MKRLLLILLMLPIMALSQNDNKPNFHVSVGTSYITAGGNNQLAANYAVSVYNFYFSHTQSMFYVLKSNTDYPIVSSLNFGYKMNYGYFSITPFVGYTTSNQDWFYEANIGCLLAVKVNKVAIYLGASMHEYGIMGISYYFKN